MIAGTHLTRGKAPQLGVQIGRYGHERGGVEGKDNQRSVEIRVVMKLPLRGGELLAKVAIETDLHETGQRLGFGW